MSDEAGRPQVLPMMTNDHRHIKDRRSRPTRFISRYTLTGRRRMARRREEATNYYVDKFDRRYIIMVVLIMVFCLLDYGLSMRIFAKGGSEFNFFMSGFVNGKRALLLLIKLGLTFFCLVFILFHKNFKVFGLIKVSSLIYYVFSLYFVLVLYEIYSLALMKKFETFP